MCVPAVAATSPRKIAISMGPRAPPSAEVSAGLYSHVYIYEGSFRRRVPRDLNFGYVSGNAALVPLTPARAREGASACYMLHRVSRHANAAGDAYFKGSGGSGISLSNGSFGPAATGGRVKYYERASQVRDERDVAEWIPDIDGRGAIYRRGGLHFRREQRRVPWRAVSESR